MTKKDQEAADALETAGIIRVSNYTDLTAGLRQAIYWQTAGRLVAAGVATETRRAGSTWIQWAS